MKKLKGLFLLFVLPGFLLAQQSFTLYNMDHIPQRNMVNPALIPNAKVNVGIPVLSSVYFNFSNSGFKYSDLIRKRADDSLYFDFDNMISKLTKNNFISSSFSDDILFFGFRKGKNYFSFNCTEKVETRFRYPKDFINFIWRGNAPFLGEELKFNFGLDYTHYREYGVGFTRELNEKLTVGGRFKYLYGMENIWTEKSDITFQTEPEFFALTATSDVIINTSNIDSTNSEESFSDYAFKRKNTGFGIDAGATYKYNDKLSFSASVLDLGYIKWRSNVVNFKSNNPGGSFTYEGVPLNYYVTKDSATIDEAVDKMLDTIKTTFEIGRHHESYTNWLSPRMYIGAHYQVSDKQKAGAIIYSQYFDGTIHPGLSLSYALKVKKLLNISATYSIYNRSWNNLGGGISLNAGPVQLYLISDNILGAILPQHTKNVNLHFGLNLTFGRAKNTTKESSLQQEH